MGNEIKLIATDLDGTLLTDQKTVTTDDMNTLRVLQSENIITVAATGRSLQKVYDVLPEPPFDYIVFSSGSGILDCRSKRIIKKFGFNQDQTLAINNTLSTFREDYIIFNPIPNNDTGFFKEGDVNENNFKKLVESYNMMPELSGDETFSDGSGQYLIIINKNLEKFENIKNEIIEKHSPIKVIRATSPVNGQDIWVELFPYGVSKGDALKEVCKMHGIKNNQVACIGNDYNDIDMLEMTPHGYVVNNAPEDLKLRFQNLQATNNESPVSETIQQIRHDVETLMNV